MAFNKTQVLLALLIFLFVYSAVSLEATQAAQCIIMPVKTDSSVSGNILDNIRTEIYLAVARNPQLEPVSLIRTETQLRQRRFNPDAYPNYETAATEAGRLLAAPYSIYTKLYQYSDQWILETGLIDVNRRQVIRHMRGRYTGELDNFVREAPAINIARMLEDGGIHETAPDPRVRRPTRPRQPREPSVSRRDSITNIPWSEWGAATAKVTQNRLEIGFRFLNQRFTDKKSNEFVGSVDHLSSKHDTWHPHFFASLLAFPWVGAELNFYNRLEAAAITSSTGHSDGNVIMRGPAASLFFRHEFNPFIYDRNIRIRLQGGAGLAFLSSSFKYTGWWHHGFSMEDGVQNAQAEYRQWKADGSPEWPNDGYQRWMEVSDATGRVLDAAAMAEIHRNLWFELYARRMWIETDVKHRMTFEGLQHRAPVEGDFNLNNYAVGIGLRYTF